MHVYSPEVDPETKDFVSFKDEDIKHILNYKYKNFDLNKNNIIKLKNKEPYWNISKQHN